MSEKRYTAPDHTSNDVIASQKYDVPAQCGDCYEWFDFTIHAICPNCGSLEVVGMR
jgi:rRNA maturation endonuclease Nob1